MISKDIPVNLPALKNLYARIGEKALGRILEDFYQRMSGDVLIGFFFDGKDLQLIASRQKEFLMRAMGAVPHYSGKPPAQAHEDLAPILSGHFDRRLKILAEILKEHGLNDEEIQTWIRFEDAFRDGIVAPDIRADL